jgi:gamma-glutamylcyclotransferase (GGCT)/AIG2-like uncharacterized protein YtfP
MPQNLFVYGTLRSEFAHPLARRLASEARLIGKASTPGILYAFRGYPGAIFDPEAKTRVIGEVYALPPAGRLLATLDAYEGVFESGTPLFQRVAVKLQLDRGGGEIDAWSYELTKAPRYPRRIESGDFMRPLGRTPARPVRS